MNNLIKDRVCLVTGATRGIGKSIAATLAQQGGIVYGTATTEAGAKTIDDYFAETKCSGFGKVMNVTNSDDVTKIVSEINEASGPPQILINNAGITRDNLLLRMKEAEWDDIMATNLKSIFTLSKACLRGMTRARYGRIINISSVVAASGNAGQSNYAAAKAGIIGFAKSLAQEVASRDITVNTIAPGFIETDMTNALNEDQRAAIINKIPLARLGTPGDIAAAVLFLASNMGSYITGETIHVNGGMYMA